MKTEQDVKKLYDLMKTMSNTQQVAGMVQALEWVLGLEKKE